MFKKNICLVAINLFKEYSMLRIINWQKKYKRLDDLESLWVIAAGCFKDHSIFYV